MEKCTLWQDLAAMRIEPAGAKRTFGSRLAQENGWSRDYAARVEAEYRRFLYLMATGDRDATPSDAVDQAWHLHLGYSRHYWEELCGRIVGRPLHHGPSAGGAVEATRYRDQYRATLARYAELFGEAPPADIWPDEETRFSGDWRRIDVREAIVLPRGKVRGALGLALALPLAACATELDAGQILPFVALLFVSVVLLTRTSRKPCKRSSSSGCGGGEISVDAGGSDCGDSGGCGGGCGGD